jgi:hypothetical protein
MLFNGNLSQKRNKIGKYFFFSESCYSIGNYDPQETNINFAVPNTHTIINYISMSIITSTLELKSKENSYILSVEGKKLGLFLSNKQVLFTFLSCQNPAHVLCVW